MPPWPVIALALLSLVLHLPSLAPSLEDIDSINFALGLRDFDVAAHQPHPPGYPVYIALGQLSRGVIGVVAPDLPQVRAEALALSIWSALAGAVAIVAAWALFAGLQRTPDAWSVWAAALLAVAPLFWVTGLRPMSDMTGLAAALTAQLFLIRGFTDRRALLAGAVIAGLAVGVRAQTVWLTMPLLLLALVANRRAGWVWLLTRPAAALAAAGLAWAIPLLAASGGIEGYLAALGTQAGEDFAWVDMLLFSPTPRRAAFALLETFVLPWGLVAAVPVLAMAAVGAVAAALTDRRALAVIAVAFAPYAVFHLLLQETFHIRYALPVLPAVAWLAARGVAASKVPVAIAAVAIVVLAASRAVPAGMDYGREPHPAFRAVEDARNAIAGGEQPDALFSHYALRRPLQADAPSGVRLVEPRRSYEWLDMLDYWVEGGRGTVWFFADPKRTDLALVDPQSRRAGRAQRTEYRWNVSGRSELGGARPTGVDWYRFTGLPGWFAAEGWSLTPETGGLAKATTMGVDREPIDAYVRRRDGPMHMVVGVRNLGGGDPAAEFELSIDDTVIDRWRVDSANGQNDLRFIDLPSGLPPGPGDLAHLSITARPVVPGRSIPPVAVRQFDIQSSDTLIYGFAEGWHEAEYDTGEGLSWRWTSERSVLRVSPARAVRLTLRGESPLRYVDGPPLVRVTAGARNIAELRPADDFIWTVTVPAEAVAAAGGAIAITTDKVYLPGEAEGTGDVRRLGLRLFEIDVDTASP